MNALGPNVINIKFKTVIELLDYLKNSQIIDHGTTPNYCILSGDINLRLRNEFRTHGYYLRDSAIESVLGLKIIVLCDPHCQEFVRLGI